MIVYDLIWKAYDWINEDNTINASPHIPPASHKYYNFYYISLMRKNWTNDVLPPTPRKTTYSQKPSINWDSQIGPLSPTDCNRSLLEFNELGSSAEKDGTTT